MTRRGGTRSSCVSGGVHPEYRQVLATETAGSARAPRPWRSMTAAG